jgi:UDP-N-acetylbacillosamine N-acetyltransferase
MTSLMKNKLVIIGAGGHTRSVINLLPGDLFEVTGIYDDSFNTGQKETICGIPVIGKIKDIKADELVVISSGDNEKRELYFRNYYGQLFKKNLVHQTAFIEKTAHLGEANQVLARVYVNTNTSIGSNNILNSGCIIEHEVMIGNHNHISVGTLICGRVNIGDHCFIGAGAVVIDKLSICSNVIIGANSVVVRNITEPGTYAGNPPRRIK